MKKSSEVFEKEINQISSLDESVDRAISEMGTVWKKCQDKLSEDSVCFLCKEKIQENEKFSIIQIPKEKCDKGLFVLCSICNKCNK